MLGPPRSSEGWKPNYSVKNFSPQRTGTRKELQVSNAAIFLDDRKARLYRSARKRTLARSDFLPPRNTSPPKRKPRPKKPKKRTPDSLQDPTMLDGYLLLDACEVEDPADAVEATLTSKGLLRTAPEDLPFFVNLTYLDLCDNSVQLEDVATLPHVRELHLACNGITSITVPEGTFQELELLDLSFNAISSDSLSELRNIPNLRELDLGGNNLKRIPGDIVVSLPVIGMLSLEKNNLSGPECLIHLAQLPTLRELNLNHNEIRRVPPEAVQKGCFPELETLGLAANSIETLEETMNLLFLPALREVHLWGNRIVKRGKRSTDLAVLEREFVRLRGISVVIRQPLTNVAPLAGETFLAPEEGDGEEFVHPVPLPEAGLSGLSREASGVVRESSSSIGLNPSVEITPSTNMDACHPIHEDMEVENDEELGDEYAEADRRRAEELLRLQEAGFRPPNAMTRPAPTHTAHQPQPQEDQGPGSMSSSELRRSVTALRHLLRHPLTVQSREFFSEERDSGAADDREAVAVLQKAGHRLPPIKSSTSATYSSSPYTSASSPQSYHTLHTRTAGGTAGLRSAGGGGGGQMDGHYGGAAGGLAVLDGGLTRDGQFHQTKVHDVENMLNVMKSRMHAIESNLGNAMENGHTMDSLLKMLHKVNNLAVKVSEDNPHLPRPPPSLVINNAPHTFPK
eukprot:Rmarinus@m.23628